MTKSSGKNIQYTRIGIQLIFVLLFFSFFILEGISTLEILGSVNWFFYFDPLIAILSIAATGTMLAIIFFSIITIVLTLIFGRFFCGWICPLGSIHQFFSWIFDKKNKKKEKFSRRLLNLKYLVLITVIVAALIGFNIGYWLDPFSLLTRSSVVVISQVDYLIGNSTKSLDAIADTNKKENSVQSFLNSEILDNPSHKSSQPYLIGGIFIGLILMNYYKRRFFCNVLCPLGGLLGLIARFSFFRLKTNSNCNQCHLCDKSCTYYGNPDKEFIKSECVVCFNCSNDCNLSAINFEFEFPKKENRTRIDIGRRKLITTAMFGLAAVSLPGASIISNNKVRHQFIRPPGAIKEKDFLDKCTRCGQCAQSCPTNFIQPSLFEAGLEGLWTPVLNASAGYCLYECTKCLQVCPTEALEKLSVKEKQIFKVGTAVINKTRCYTYADGMNCTKCEEVCPTPDKAIKFRKEDVWNFQGKRKIVNQIYVIPDLCNGCGICEYVCPRHDEPGIFITAEDEIRELTTGDV